MRTIMTVHDSPDVWIRMEPVVRALHSSELLRPVGDVTPEPRDDAESLVGSLRPDAVLVESPSPRALAAVRAASRLGVPVAHLSAGRRGNAPAAGAEEEPACRELDRLSRLHLAPTEHAARVLLGASVPEHRIVVTGDTLVDAVAPLLPADPATAAEQPIVLVAVHRPEHAGAPLRRLGAAVRILATRFPSHAFVLSGGPDLAQHAGLGPDLGRTANIHSLGQPRFDALLELIGRSVLVLTDCTRIEEVAPSRNVPVLVLGDTTARPEGVLAGTSAVIGTRVERMVEAASGLLTDPVLHAAMAGAASPFGDGRAAARVVAALAHLLGCGTRLPDFVTPLRRESVAAR